MNDDAAALCVVGAEVPVPGGTMPRRGPGQRLGPKRAANLRNSTRLLSEGAEVWRRCWP
jgi:hypothetical protein